jgi:hypothetical protein
MTTKGATNPAQTRRGSLNEPVLRRFEADSSPRNLACRTGAAHSRPSGTSISGISAKVAALQDGPLLDARLSKPAFIFREVFKWRTAPKDS